ncbi:hypothetical protein [Sediminicola sp. 1XM1-17]|uniref:hypothetical protein n=1 Tax=Sediminicola sp. 1XM1-17 TaxID=3127702 RepID=UPI003076F19A
MVILAKWILILFGTFLIAIGFLMLLLPSKVRQLIKMAGSTPVINYTEITVRMIPAAALVLYAEYAKYAFAFQVLGWFMLATSLILFFVPIRIHHQYALTCAAILKPLFIRCISPLSFLFGLFIIYGTLG